MPLGEDLVPFVVLFKVTFWPSKQTELSSEDPPTMLQKSELDCQVSLSLLVEFVGVGAWPCNDGENGEFLIGMF